MAEQERGAKERPLARGPRALGAVCAGLAAAAALLWGASAATWAEVTEQGRTPVALDGAQVLPSLTGLALVALAGVAAMVATGGVLRRVLGALLGVVGVLVGVLAVQVWVSPPDAASGTREATAAPLLAVTGGMALLVVGLFVLVREPRLARFGARYARQDRRPVEVDPDRAAWLELDAGRDPTADARDVTGDDPGGGSRTGAV